MIQAYRGEILTTPAPDTVRHYPDGLLVVEDGLVVALGAYADLAGRFGDMDVEMLPGLIVPGFIDTHIHYPQTSRIAAHGQQLLSWLEQHIFPAEKAFADRAHADAIAAFFLDELLRNGTTSALVFATVHEGSVDALFEAALSRNMRIISGKVLMDLGPEGLRDTPETARGDTEALIARWRGRGRLGYAVTPRFALTSSDAQLAVAGDLLAAHGDIMMHTHMAENTGECAAVEARFGAAHYIDAYDRFGLVGPRSLFAHCIHMSDAAMARMGEAGSAIAFCPTSNLFLGSGLFDLSHAARFGVKVGMGTDVGAGTSFSMLSTQGEAYKVGQMRGAVLDPFHALYLATAGGARALGLEDRIGGLQAGQEADFIVLDDKATPLLALRTQGAGLAERLFAMQILGDDRCVARTYIAGILAHSR
jgi:guanine deaminase